MARRSTLIGVVILLVLTSLATAFAQQGVGSIRGRVTDEQKGVLPGVAIIVTHMESGTIRETTSGDDGTYLVPGLIPGPYKISAQLSGFSRLTQEDLLLRVGVTMTVDLALKVGAVEENITVTAESPQVDLTTAQVGGSVNSGDLTNLPSGSRNFTSLVALLPGVVYNAAADSSSDSVTINGQASTGVVYLMDGASNNDDLRGGSSGAQARPPMEGIQEFQVVTNQFDAEYGAATAGVVNAVSKQGTNAFHGSGFGYFTDDSMTAKDFFVAQQGLDKPQATKKQWGGTIGGPIVQDKMHFFASFERQDRDEGRSRVYPSRPDKSFTVAQQTNSWNYMGRLDHQLNSSQSYGVRFLWDHQPNYDQVLGGSGSPPTQGTLETLSIEKDNDWTLVANHNWVMGGAKLNTLRAQAVHEKPKRGQPLYQESGDWTLAAPTIQHINFIDVADVNYADYRDMNTYGVDDTFSWFVNGSRGGTHDLKFGSQYQLQEHYREDQRFMNGAFQLTTDNDFNAAIPSTYPERLTIRVPQMVQLLSLTHSVGVFAQDKWQINQHLTLSAGLRYDIHVTPLLETWNPMFADEGAYPIDKNNWQPRVGFAYAMGPAAVLRGGYGIFYEKQYVDRYENYSLNRVFTNSFQAQYPVAGPDPGPSQGRLPTDPLLVNGPVLNRALINQIVPPGSLARNTGTVWLDNPARILPWQHQASIGYERQIGRQLAVAADYMHIVNKDMPLRYNLNPGIKQTTSRTEVPRRTDLLGIANSLGITPFPVDVYTVEYIGETKYDGLNLAIEKRYADNWSARFSYALGKGEGNTNGTPTAANDFQVLDQRNVDQNYGPTSADRRHAVTISGRTEVRKIPGLTAGAVVRMATGTSFTVHNSNIDANKNGVAVDPLPAGTYSGVGENALTVENAGGRNGAYGPGTLQLDIRAGYKWRLNQVRAIDFFFEVFNLTNEANFANPSGDVRSGTTFLVPTALAGGGFPRQFQIGARYGF